MARRDWYCFECDKFVTETHIKIVCDRGAMTGMCKKPKETDGHSTGN